MKRDIYKLLIEWKNDEYRRPLLLRGARQVGKTHIVNQFGHDEFETFIDLNFEKNPEYKEIFKSLDPDDIIENVSLFTGMKIEPGKTLLFLDEVQDCPAAIMALRYFYEEKQSLHVIAAGSLLEFTIRSQGFKMPVGRVQYLFLFPLSFGEFLDALGEAALRKHISDPGHLKTLPDAIHRKLNDYIKKYFMLGGMPSVISQYIRNRDIIACQRIQQSIIDTYLDDFGKYASQTKYHYLSKIFNAVPTMVGQKFKYSRVDNTIRSRELKQALELLEMAGIVRKIKRTGGAGLPLEAGTKEQHFKMLFLDIGLLHAVNKIYSDTVQAKDLNSLFKGAVAEQFVGQELIACQNPYTRPGLYYWAREAKNSNAEIDFLIQKNSIILPIEVKSGAVGKMKSLFMFLEKYKSNQGLKISQARFSEDKNILCLPFYAIETFIKIFL